MSDTSSIFGDEGGAIGPVNAYWDAPVETGDTGDNVYLGKTQGFKFRDEITKTPILFDQDGTEQSNAVVTGEKIECEGNFGQISLQRMQILIQGFVAPTSGTVGGLRESRLSEDDLSIAKPMKLVKLIGDVESTDPDDILFLPVMCPTGKAELAYDAATQRVMNIMFRSYKSQRYTRASNGSKLFYFTLSNYLNGYVAVGSGDLL